MTDKKQIERYRKLPLMLQRDLLEGFAAAVILAFIFRGFVAEAYVIPTGSMAHGLQGRHMDHECPKCNFPYRSGASEENDGDGEVIATTCPQCGFVDVLDKVNEINERSFSGDRILVNKFAYALSDPERWDVIVFKYPYEATTNYIKRLIGLPGEVVRLSNGDVYTRPTDNLDAAFEMARKPVGKQLSMMQLVYDTQYRSSALDEVMWPQPRRMVGEYRSRYHPSEQEGVAGYWSMSTQGFKATIDGSRKEETVGLRYHHHIPDSTFWVDYNQHRVAANLAEKSGDAIRAKKIREGMKVRWWPLPKLITDAYAYNRVINDDVSYFGEVVFASWDQAAQPVDNSDDAKLTAFISNFREHLEGDQIIAGRSRDLLTQNLKIKWPSGSDRGNYWVGDLAVEFEISVANDTGTIGFDIVESGVYYQGSIDIATGELKLSIDNGNELFVGESSEVATIQGATNLKGAGEYEIRFSNFDNELRVWLDGELIELSQKATYVTDQILGPKWSERDPGDLMPAGISSKGVAMTVKNARVFRDGYYIATNQAGFPMGTEYNHWSMSELQSMRQLVAGVEPFWMEVDDWDSSNIYKIAKLRLHLDFFPLWTRTKFFTDRATVEFEVAQDEFLPMGDNSPASSDGRGWYPILGKNSFHRSLLIGEALMIYWPHAWYIDLGGKAVPAIPNFPKIKVIQ